MGALLNLNPWTRQSSHKNIYLLHLVARKGEESGVGSSSLLLGKEGQVVFSLSIFQLDEKNRFQIPFVGESASLRGSRRPEMRILRKDCEILIFILSSLLVNIYLNAVYLYRNLSKKCIECDVQLVFSPINVFLTSGILCLFKIRKLLTICFVYLC